MKRKLLIIASFLCLVLSGCAAKEEVKTTSYTYDLDSMTHITSTFDVQKDEVVKQSYKMVVENVVKDVREFYLGRNKEAEKAFKKTEGIKVKTSDDENIISFEIVIDFDKADDNDVDRARLYMDQQGFNYEKFKEIDAVYKRIPDVKIEKEGSK